MIYKEKLKKHCVGIAGAGGLGSNCAMALARSGIGKLIISDYDIIEESNLNRQYYFFGQIGQNKVEALKTNIKKTGSDTIVDIHHIKLNKNNIIEIYKDCDIIVEAFDKAEMKIELIECIQEYYPEKPIIIGSGMAGFGNSNNISLVRDGQLYICGDHQSDIDDGLDVFAPMVNMVASMQADIVLDLLLKK